MELPEARRLAGTLLYRERGRGVSRRWVNETELARRPGVGREAFGLVPECAPILAAASERVRFGDPTRPDPAISRRSRAQPLLPRSDPGLRRGRHGADRDAVLRSNRGPSAGSGKGQYRLVLGVFRSLGETLPKRAIRTLAAGSDIEDRVFEAGLRKWRAQHPALKREPDVLSGEIVIAQAVLERMARPGAATEVLVPPANAGAARPKASLADPSRPLLDIRAEVAAAVGAAASAAAQATSPS